MWMKEKNTTLKITTVFYHKNFLLKLSAFMMAPLGKLCFYSFILNFKLFIRRLLHFKKLFSHYGESSNCKVKTRL